MRRARIAAGAMGLVALLLVLATPPPAETEAAWTTAERATGTFVGAVVQPPGTLACSGGGSLLLAVPDVVFTWAAPAIVANSAIVTEYRWTMTRASVVERTGTSATTSATIVGSGLAFGTYTFSVVAGSGTIWSSVPGPTGTYTKVNNLISLIQTSGCSTP